MSILLRYNPEGATIDQYEESMKRLADEVSPWPPEGMQYHCAFRTNEGGFRVSEVWDTREHADAFMNDNLRSVLEDIGITMSAEPEEFEVLNQQSTMPPMEQRQQ